MKPSRVPDDLIEAAGNAIRAWYAARPSSNSYLDDRTRIRLVLAAALTLHNEQIEQPLRERPEKADAAMAAVNNVLREYGFEYPLGARGVRDVAVQRSCQQERAEIAERELAEARNALSVAAELVDRLAFDDECDYDHNACCQAHSEHEHPCPHPLGRQFVEAWRAVEAEQQLQGAPGGPE